MRRVKIVGLLAVCLFVAALGARATTLPVSGSGSWGEAVEFYDVFNGPGLTFSASSCGAPETQFWTGPFTTITEFGGCTSFGSATYGADSWSESMGYTPSDQLGSEITGTPGTCGKMVIGPSDLWTEKCDASFSGSFAAGPPYGQTGPVLSGTTTGNGSITFFGSIDAGIALVDGFQEGFKGTADITTPATEPIPEPSSVWLMLTGAALISAEAMVRKIRAVK